MRARVLLVQPDARRNVHLEYTEFHPNRARSGYALVRHLVTFDDVLDVEFKDMPDELGEAKAARIIHYFGQLLFLMSREVSGLDCTVLPRWRQYSPTKFMNGMNTLPHADDQRLSVGRGESGGLFIEADASRALVLAS
ncbi:hypothetical protein [Streptomyces sp. NPDC059071]|uniref:hypothetical protein n=1 Tax=unclassified Streptomyces TaxID=2593676 RepID=UPI00365349A1